MISMMISHCFNPKGLCTERCKTFSRWKHWVNERGQRRWTDWFELTGRLQSHKHKSLHNIKFDGGLDNCGRSCQVLHLLANTPNLSSWKIRKTSPGLLSNFHLSSFGDPVSTVVAADCCLTLISHLTVSHLSTFQYKWMEKYFDYARGVII